MRKKGKEDCRFIDRVGEKYPTNEGDVAEVIECFGSNNLTVRFKDGTIIKNRSIGNLRKGKVLNPNKRTLCGVGYIGVGKYSSSKNNKRTICYYKWADMIKRCYSEKEQNSSPTYRIVTVNEKWHNFQNFAEWFYEKYKPEYMEKWQLDKDILKKGNKTYSSETCCLVPREINMLFVKNNKSRGNLPIGVTKDRKRFKAELNGRYLDSFDTPKEAFECYKFHKEKRIKEVADEWQPLITPELYDVMYNYEVEITD
jgi:hypothetical protein